MKMTFKVVYDDGREVTAVAKPKDIVEFERRFNTPFSTFARGGAPMEWIWFLAWSPLNRTGQDPRSFDDFMSAVDSIDDVEEPAPVPFPQGPSDASSADSPPISA